eukprot:s58_g27.t1
MQQLMRHLFREWHPDKRHDDEKVLATRVFQWLQEETAWELFDHWSSAGRVDAMHGLAPAVLARPYCEPGKLAWLATTCLLLFRGANEEQALECAGSLDEDMLSQMTVLSLKHETRLHLVLRSPWPAFRMLDLLARLIPQSLGAGGEDGGLGACKKNTMWNSDPDVFDWPQFKSMLADAATQLVSDESVFQLRQEDGPLSRQYIARHDPSQELVYISHDVFDAYRKSHYKAGVISSYILQILVVHLRDIEGRLQKLVSIVANLVNELTASKDAALTLVADVGKAVKSEAAKGAAGSSPMIFVTSAWGWMSEELRGVLRRWRVVSKTSPLLVLCRDRIAADACDSSADLHGGPLRCVKAPRRLGVEAIVAKYLVLAALVKLSVHAVWLDLDILVLSDPAPPLSAELAQDEEGQAAHLIFVRHLLSQSVSPAVIVARGTAMTASILMGYAGWLRENPYLLDHQGWDQYLSNNHGDYAGLFDYKGRNTTNQDPDGPGHTFLASRGLAPEGTKWSFLSKGFGSGDGWQGHPEGSDLIFFHFWGASESQKEMFEIFYPKRGARSSLSQHAMSTILKYRRQPVSAPTVPALLRARNQKLHVIAISYAHGCCTKSLKRNRDHALQAGVDEARSYGKEHLGPDWQAANSKVLLQKRGGGWWLWKPYDPALPWDTGVVLWVDAGNYLHADPRPILHEALEVSDILALRLKQCLEADWTSKGTVEKMYAILDRPQLGAYFLAFRKTKAVLDFDPEMLLGLQPSAGGEPNEEEDVPTFQKHQADQSIFSMLFKSHGYQATPLDVEARMDCVLPENWEAEQRARTAAKAAIKAVGNSTEEVGAAVKGQGKIGAEEAANRIVELGRFSTEGVQPLAFKAWRAASAAGVSSKVASQAALDAILPRVMIDAMGTGDSPAETGRMVMRLTRAIPGLTEEQRVNSSLAVGKRVMNSILTFANVPEEAIEAALKAVESGVVESSVAVPLETVQEWLHPEFKVDFERCSHRASEVAGHLLVTSKSKLPKEVEKKYSKASKRKEESHDPPDSDSDLNLERARKSKKSKMLGIAKFAIFGDVSILVSLCWREDDDDLLIDRSRPKTTDVKKTKSKKPKARDADSEGSDLQLQRPSKKEMKAKTEKDAPKPKAKEVKPPDSDAYFGWNGAVPSNFDRVEPSRSRDAAFESFGKGKGDGFGGKGDGFGKGKDGKGKGKGKEDPDAPPKEQPNFEPSGLLALEDNAKNGIPLKFTVPAEARRPATKWRLYVFAKQNEGPKMIHIYKNVGYLFGKDRRIVDVPTDHPTCSKQHAVLHYRVTTGGIVKPYIMDLESVNGTFVNGKRIEAARYVELREKDADSPILSKASAAEDAAAMAAARARGSSPAEIGAKAKEAILALGSHQAAAMHLAAKAAANVAMFEAQRHSKSPREMGQAAKVAALAAGLHGADEWLILKAQIARRVAEVAAAAGFKPDQVGQAVREATVDDGVDGVSSADTEELVFNLSSVFRHPTSARCLLTSPDRMDAADFCRCCALASSPSLSPDERRMVEASLLQLRRLPSAAQVCGLVLLQSDPSAAFHAALTLKYSTLFNWPRLTGAEQDAALQLMMRALHPPQQVLLQDWAPVREQALLAIALYWKKGFLEGRQLSLLACSHDAQRAAQLRFSTELPGLLQRAACEADSSALAACAAWTFPSAPPEGWAISCAQVAFALSSADHWDLALDFAGQHCLENQAMWVLVLAAAARPSQRYAAATCAAQLRTEPDAEQALELAKRAAELMKEDFSLEEQLDALVKLLEVLSRRSQSLELQNLLLDHFFPEILARANVPDFYDETLGSADRNSSCSDVLQLMAQLTGQRPRIGHENSLDVKHVALCFAAEVVAVNPQAGATFAGILCTMMQKFESPLLMADAWRRLGLE